MTNTWLDSYPYGAISIFAIHPLYLNVIEVGRVKERSFMSNYKQKCQYLNSLESIDYEAVLKLKHEYLRKIYEIEGDKTLKSKSFIDFYENNREWLDNYSLFCYFRDKYKTADFRTWKEFSVYDKSATDRLISKRSKIYKDIAYYYFIQYHLHIQLSEAHSYANKNGVILKGDIPIGINKTLLRLGLSLIYSTLEDKQALLLMTFRYVAKIGASPHIDGILWRKMDSVGGKIGSQKCPNILMHIE